MTQTKFAYDFPDLAHLFSPRTIAVVGASERPGSIGQVALNNIIEHSDFSGTIYPVNPRAARVGGMPSYPDVASLPEAVDVVLIVIPAQAVMEAVRQAAEKGCRFTIILTSGFSEAGAWGRTQEAEFQRIARNSGMRIYGTNCPGLVNNVMPLGMSLSPAFKDDIAPGPIAIATQGGGLGRVLLQNNVRGIGVSYWASTGNECDLEVADFIHHYSNDPDIRAIGCIFEGIRDGARLIEACRYAAHMGKPVIAMKIGHSELGAKSAASHTAAISGSAEVNSAVFRQLGVIEVGDVDELIDVAQLLARKTPTGDEKIIVVTPSGGAGALCADHLGIEDLELSQLTDKTRLQLTEILPDYAAIDNPIDVTALMISNPQIFQDALVACAQDENTGLVIASIPMDYASHTGKAARYIVEAQRSTETPIQPLWSSERPGEGYQVLAEHGLTPIRSNRNLRLAVRRWIDYGRWKAGFDAGWVPQRLADGAFSEPETNSAMSETDAKHALAKAGVATTSPVLATTAAEALAAGCDTIGPFAMKIVSPDVLHKTDVGGVRLNVETDDLPAAFGAIIENVTAQKPCARIEGVLIERMAPSGGLEILVGVARDPVFGHIMTVGLGGIYVEVFRDVSRRMLPVSETDAREMLREIASAPLIFGSRGQPARDVDALATLIARTSDFVVSQSDTLEELDLNPVWLGQQGEGAFALDAVVIRRG